MPSLRQLRRRVRSVQNTQKITRAMQMVASVKMRRAQQAVLASRPYSDKMAALLSDLAAMPQADQEEPPRLLERRDPQRITLLHITPDRGLCGALPGNLNRRGGAFILESQPQGPVSVVAVGRKGRDFMARYARDLRAVFQGLGDRPSLADISPIAHLVMDDFISGETDAVYLIYAQFVNTVTQRPEVRRLLPVEPAALDPAAAVGYIYEPSPAEALEGLLPRYVEALLYQAIREGIASEESARMVAMRNATDNAEDLIRDLTLVANKVRQASITAELLDIISGAMGLEG
jgi:F-type H+-transporting ATPase subunit gamma